MSVENQSVRQRREAIVVRHIDAENSGDLEAMLATFIHPRYQVVPLDLVSDGADAVRTLIAELGAAFPDFHFEPTVIHHADTAVIVEARMTGTHRREWAGLQPHGAKMDVALVCVFDFDEDRLLSETVYFDFATVQRQLG